MVLHNEKEIGISEVLKLLAHRYPFQFLDKILAYEQGKNIHGLKNLTYNEKFFQGHFPEKPIMPGVLMVEAIAQLVASLLFLDQKNQGKHFFLAGIEKARFRQFAQPGDQLHLHAEWVKSKKSLHWFNGKISVNGKKIMDTTIMIVEYQLTLED